MRKVLVISAVVQRPERLARGLAAFHYDSTPAKTGAEAWASIIDEMPDAIVIDTSTCTSQFDPWLLCTELNVVVRRPMVTLIRSGRNQDRLKALRLGARQCLAVPVTAEEVAASLDALFTQNGANGDLVESTPRHYGDSWLEIDLPNRCIRRGGDICALTAKEYELLECLLRDIGNVVPADKLSRALWGEGDNENKLNHLKAYVARLRHKIERDPAHPCYILSRHGFGYLFMPQHAPEYVGK